MFLKKQVLKHLSLKCTSYLESQMEFDCETSLEKKKLVLLVDAIIIISYIFPSFS